MTEEGAEREPAPDPELEKLLSRCEKAFRFSEGGKDYVYLEKLQFYVGNESRVMDAILCPRYRDSGYLSKLLFKEKITDSPTARNWNESQLIRDEKWESWSWQDVKSDQPLIDILLDQLRAFQ